MNQFDDIRPYTDDEVRPTIDRLLNDSEFLTAVCHLKFPKAPNFLLKKLKRAVKRHFTHQTARVNNVYDFQILAKKYARRVISKTMDGVTVSGLENVQTDKAHLFISNHRDIALDPVLINYVLFNNNYDTVNVAIGDNLLTRSYIADLMRLNKSFIVNRSATAPRQKLNAAKHLSAYINHCITKENVGVWIAQREGRAKDGIDVTNSALISMLSLDKPKQQPLIDYIHQLNIIPVSISYEWDPCDFAKANELYIYNTAGNYEKEEHEDFASIIQGITGQKGRVHIAFGEALTGNYQTTDDIVAELDKSIIDNYVLHPSNCLAYRQLFGELPPTVELTNRSVPFDQKRFKHQTEQFNKRLEASDEKWRSIFLTMYANPIVSKYPMQ